MGNMSTCKLQMTASLSFILRNWDIKIKFLAKSVILYNQHLQYTQEPTWANLER